MTQKTKSEHSKKKVLLIEDNELNLKLFRDLLLIKDFDVLPVNDGTMAIKSAIDYSPNLIIMDIQLNGISGLDIVKQIKAHPQLTNIPIIAVTAFAMKDDKEKILNAGCQAYIAKPVSIDKFYQVIAQLISTSR